MNNKTASPGEREESDFNSYHIIVFKCPVLKKEKKIT